MKEVAHFQAPVFLLELELLLTKNVSTLTAADSMREEAMQYKLYLIIYTKSWTLQNS